MSKPTAVIVGGGITGLVAALALASTCDVTLFEQDATFGGKLQSTTFRGRPLDVGPDAFITRNGAAVALCRAVGLEDQLIAPAVSSAAIFARAALRPFPSGLVMGIPTNRVSLALSGLVSPTSVLRTLFDLVGRANLPTDLIGNATNGTFDPSVAQVIEPRMGRQVFDTLVDPLVGGINASDARYLSFAAALPHLVEQIAGRTSLMQALRPKGPTTQGTVSSPPLFFGLAGGLSQLIDHLSEQCRGLGVTLIPATPVRAITPQPSDSETEQRSWEVAFDGGSMQADALVLATPAFVTSELVRNFAPELANLCDAIPYAGVATVTGAWPQRTIDEELHRLAPGRGHPSTGGEMPTGRAGVLIPRQYGHLTTAMSFTSSKWPLSANTGEVVIRASVGRQGDERSFGLDDEALIASVRADLAVVLGIKSAPLDVHIARFPRAFPQYTVGHLHRVAQIKTHERRFATLCLAGAGYGGIGIPACIDSGEAAARTVQAALSR